MKEGPCLKYNFTNQGDATGLVIIQHRPFALEAFWEYSYIIAKAIQSLMEENKKHPLKFPHISINTSCLLIIHSIFPFTLRQSLARKLRDIYKNKTLDVEMWRREGEERREEREERGHILREERGHILNINYSKPSFNI